MYEKWFRLYNNRDIDTQATMAQLKIAIIGQSNFAADVYKLLKQNGHHIIGVFTIPDKGNREDPLGE